MGTALPSSTPPILKKITHPELQRTAKRGRLFRLLDQNGKKKGVWVSGPAGAGKSTLVRSYLAERGIPFIWYRVDADDIDPASFFYYMGLAVDQGAVQKAPKLPLLSPEYLLGLNAFIIRYFEKVCHRLPQTAWMVFDNYQKVPPGSPLQGILGIAVRHVTPGMKVCIISRTEPDPAMVRLLANRQMTLIDGPQLLFTVREYRQVMQLMGLHQKWLQKAEALHRLTGGWIAGLILWLQHARNTTDDDPAVEQMPAFIFDYFANEVLDQLEPPVRQFLLQVSFLLEMTTENSIRLTGNPRAGKIIERFARQNFFLEENSSSSKHYQFHSLFRRFLLDRAGNTLPVDRLRDLRCRAASIMGEAGLWNESVRLYEQAEDWKAIAELILSQAPGLAAQGRFQTLVGWLDKLPPAVLDKNPFLLLWAGIGRMHEIPMEGQQICARAFDGFKSTDDILGQVKSWCSVVDSYFLIRSDFKELDKWIEEGLRIAQSISDWGDPNLEGRFCSGMIGAFLWRRPNHTDMPKWQQMGEKLIAVCTDSHTIAALLNVLCFSYNWFGQTNKAMALKVRLKSIMARFIQEPILQTLWSANEGMCFLSEGRPQQCLQQCERALQFAEKAGIHIYDPLLLSGCIYSTLLLNRVEVAHEYLQKMADNILPGARWDWTNFYALSTWLAFMSDDIAKAKIFADRNMGLLESCGTPYNIAYMAIIRAQVMLHAENFSEARSDLERVSAMNILPNAALLKFLFELTAAEMDILTGHRKEAGCHLRQAFSVAAENGCYFLFGFNRKRLPELCAMALQAGIETAFVAKLIQKYQLPSPTSGVTVDSWPYDLKIYTLGRREIYRRGKRISLSSTKPPKKSLELLMALICAGRKGMTRETIADLLWPDTDGDRAHQNMNTTLYRLRRLLRREGAILSESGRLSLSRQYCCVDAWRFEALVDHAMTADSPAKKAELLKKAVSFYAGPIEIDTVAELSVSYAERLRSKFTCTILDLGVYLCENGQAGKAVDLYQHALDIEDTAESVYHALIRVLTRLGRNTEAAETYCKCRRTLKTKLGTEPGPTTQALYREVKTAT